jgi:cell division protease FtsH
MQRPVEDRFLMGRAELLNRMTVLMGGRAAETLLFPDVSTGAADDLMRATEIARSMVVRFGMDATLGQVTFEPEQSHLLGNGGMDWRPRQYSEATAAAIDAAIRGLVDTAFGRAKAILKENTGLLRESAEQLLAAESLAGPALDVLAAKVKPWREGNG